MVPPLLEPTFAYNFDCQVRSWLFTIVKAWEASNLQALAIHKCGNTKSLHISTFASPNSPTVSKSSGGMGRANVEMWRPFVFPYL